MKIETNRLWLIERTRDYLMGTWKKVKHEVVMITVKANDKGMRQHGGVPIDTKRLLVQG